MLSQVHSLGMVLRLTICAGNSLFPLRFERLLGRRLNNRVIKKETQREPFLAFRRSMLVRAHPGSLDSWRGICSKSPEHDADHGETEECSNGRCVAFEVRRAEARPSRVLARGQ